MKSKLFYLMLIAVTLFSCSKREVDNTDIKQDVVFSAIEVDPGSGLKSTNDWECKDLIADYAHVIIDGIDYYPEVFRLDGVLYTQAIKLPVGEYTVTQFLLMDDNGTPGDLNDDEIVMGTPVAASDYAVYVTTAVNFDFDVVEFTKLEIDVEVLCFQDAEYDAFGFDWFQITEIVIREQCFFGDICVDPADYIGSAYEGQANGLQVDMPAIFEIRAYKNGNAIPYSPFSNLAWLGEGAPLCVQYPDNINVDGEEFTFELWVLIKVGNSFEYVYFSEFTFEDEELITGGTDGIIDFAIGTCSPESDYIYSWPVSVNMLVKAADLATGFTDPDLLSKWFFYNDETDVIDNSLGSFVAGPGTAPEGTGSAQITVSGTARVNLATYQFYSTPLDEITTLAFSTYNASATNNYGPNASGYLHFNVSFDGVDSWQKRLVFVPSDNGAVTADSWQEWNTVNPGSLWRWSGAIGGGIWPDGVNATTRTWSDILAAFPNAQIRATDSFLGIRVGEPYAAGYTENLDAIKFQTNGPLVTYNFDN